jgi:pyrroline-5-carboxylate reductase
MRIAVIGGGVMGETLVNGFLRFVDPAPQIVVAEARPERAAELARTLDVRPAVHAARGADVVVLAVKPADVAGVAEEIASHVAPGTIVLSIAAGIRTADLEARLPGAHVVRAMPNTPARIDRGMTGISAGASCPAESLQVARGLMAAVGAVVEVPESLQDAVTAVSGSGPAYVFLLAEAMIDAAEAVGLDREAADAMVRQTILGAAMLLSASDDPPEVLRRNVTSPNGTTAAALGVLEERELRAAVAAAIAAARDRSRELAGGAS